MTYDDLDHILSREQEILPSSRFVVSVMDAVRREAEAPPPIPFPWKRALPGLCAGFLALVALIVVSTMVLRDETAIQSVAGRLPSQFTEFCEAWRSVGANWIALALALSLSSIKLSKRFVSAKP